MKRLLGMMIGVLAFAIPTARAGIMDSPIPAPFTKLVYSVPGVVNNGPVGTFFSCTNADVANTIVGVEVFGAAGGTPLNDASATSLTIPQGGTVLMGTQGAAGFVVDQLLAPGLVTKGSARIVATSTRLICTAFVPTRTATHRPR